MTDPDPKARRREAARKWARQERARLKAQGLVPVTVYVRPEDRERVKRYAMELTAGVEPAT